MEPVIRFQNAEIVNGESTVIYDFNMEVFPGDFVYIVGKVGTGKTSIIKTMIAENPLGAGEAEVCGFQLKGIRDRNIPFLRRKMGVVFQDFQLLMDRSVHDNLNFVLEATGWKNRESAQNRINEVLEAVGMSRKAHKMPHQLSGGEQQRIAIARALLNSPKVILADEPTGNLDSETAEGIMQLLRRLNSEGTAIIMVTHNLSIVKDYPGRVFVCANEACTEDSPKSVASTIAEAGTGADGNTSAGTGAEAGAGAGADAKADAESSSEVTEKAETTEGSDEEGR